MVNFAVVAASRLDGDGTFLNLNCGVASWFGLCSTTILISPRAPTANMRMAAPAINKVREFIWCSVFLGNRLAQSAGAATKTGLPRKHPKSTKVMDEGKPLPQRREERRETQRKGGRTTDGR